jgi:hypothetical protein
VAVLVENVVFASSTPFVSYIYAWVAVQSLSFTTVNTDTCCVSVIFTPLYPTWLTCVLSKVTQCALFCEVPAIVTVVSTKLVVNQLSNTVAVAFASINVPLGSPALSVSILTHKFTDGLTYFLNASFNVVLAVPLQNTGILTLVLAVTSPISCTLVEAANVGTSSLNKLSPAVTFSHTK